MVYVDPYWHSHTHTDITYTYSGASIRTSWIPHICMASGESELVGCTGCCPGDLRIGNGYGYGRLFKSHDLAGFWFSGFWDSRGFDREVPEVLCISEIIEWGSR